MTKPNPLTSDEIREGGSRLCLTPLSPGPKRPGGKPQFLKLGTALGLVGGKKEKPQGLCCALRSPCPLAPPSLRKVKEGY